jgi:cell division protein FtsN
MYKDYKRNESLDTDFVGGSGIIWMFSGIILGLLVGLGMYYFTDNNSSALSMVGTVQNKIKQAQSAKAKVSYKPNKALASKPEIRQTEFSYYAVLPTLDVPVGSARPINTNPLQGTTNTKVSLPIAKEVPVAKKDPIETAEIERAVSDGDYLLQVASYKKKSRASLTRGRLTKSGIEAYIQEKKIKGRLWYRVVAGPVDQTSVGNWKHAAEKMGHRPLVISLR